MNKPIAIILSVVFIMFLLGSLGFLIYNVFDNTIYPDEEYYESTQNDEDSGDVELTDLNSLTELTLQDAKRDLTELPRGCLLPPARTRFQCLLPPLVN